TFNAGTVNGSNTTKQQLWLLKLANLAPDGTSVTLTATPSPAHGGDGFANLGYLNAAGCDLATVKVDGDLGRIDAGNKLANNITVGALKVQSWGRFGTSTQGPGSNLNCSFFGDVGSIRVQGDMA